MARLFSVPRQIGGGGGAGFTRLFVQRQQHQLRHWFVYLLLLLLILLSFKDQYPIPSVNPKIRETYISRQLRLHDHRCGV